MAPAIKILSTFEIKELSKSILVDTFAPPTIARTGCIGSSKYNFKLSNLLFRYYKKNVFKSTQLKLRNSESRNKMQTYELE
jgi:hypothetical protein